MAPWKGATIFVFNPKCAFHREDSKKKGYIMTRLIEYEAETETEGLANSYSKG